MMRLRLITLTMVLGIVFAGVLGSGRRPSSGQQQNIRKQPACTLYCGNGPDTFATGAKPCWGGPLPADGAGDYFKNLSEEDQKAVCQNLAGKSHTSCPAANALAALCGGKEKDTPPDKEKPPKCKERGPSDVPWFDPSAEGCQQLQDTRLNADWTSASGGTCTITLTACNYTVLTYTVNLVEEANGKLKPIRFPATGQPAPRDPAAMGTRPIRRSECTTQLYQDEAGDYPGKVCCDIWREGVSAGSGCNPETDADCDGLPNDRDHYLNSEPYHAPPRPGSYQEPFFQGASDFNPANFDPRPPGLSWDEVMPNEPCKKCKWMALSGKLTCSPDGRTEHEYKATWVCPTTGAQRTVTRRAPASAPCTAPRR